MKGLVMEIDKKNMVIMKEDGSFINTRCIDGAQIGEEVTVSETSPIWDNIYRYASVAAVIMILLLGGVQAKAYYTPYGYLNIDINPSIQVEFNKFERIIGVNGLNEDGKKVISNTEGVKNLRLEDGIQKLVQTAGKNDYLKDDTENDIMLSVYSPDSSNIENINNKVNNSVILYLNSKSKKAELINQTVTRADLDNAILQNISVGKLILYQRAKEVEPSITIEEVKIKPIREIIMIIKKKKNEEKIGKKEEKTDERNTVVPITPTEPKNENKINQPQIENNNNQGNSSIQGPNDNQNRIEIRNGQTILQSDNAPQIESRDKVQSRIGQIEQRMENTFIRKRGNQ